MGGNAGTGDKVVAAGSPTTGGSTTTGGNAATSDAGTGGNATSGSAGGAGNTATSDAGSGGNATSGSAASAGNGALGGAAGSGGFVNGGRGGAGPSGESGADGTAGSDDSWPSGDEFEGTELDKSWTILRPDLADVAVAAGALSITPKPNDLWYQASQGVLVYKLLSGDFKVTTTVHARKANDPNTPPAQFADVGGLMARSPSGGAENYVLGVVGYAEMNELAVEHKSTKDSQSDYGETPFAADAELRLCRTGPSFTIYYRHPGDSGWPASVAPIERADLPAELEVGLVAYTGASSPDYVSSFERIAFEPIGAGCDQ
jgi:hypothetical protein